jgi:hypothetical protein
MCYSIRIADYYYRQAVLVPMLGSIMVDRVSTTNIKINSLRMLHLDRYLRRTSTFSRALDTLTVVYYHEV